MIQRITILGGSSVYIPEFIVAIIAKNIGVQEIVLYGRPGKKLDLVAGFCQRIVKKSGFPTNIIPCTELDEAVTGATFVVNHIRVGGMKARLRDERLPLKFGMVGDESLGAGGFASALRTLPVILEAVAAIERLSPKATFINLANPMGAVMQALAMTSPLRAMGVCDMPSRYVHRLAEMLRLPPNELDVDFIGLDRMGWIQDLRHEGRSVMGRILEHFDEHEEDDFDSAVIRLFRMVPTRTASLYYHYDTVLKEQQERGRFRAQALHEAEKQILKLYEDKSLTEIPELTRERNALWYRDAVAPLIAALDKGPTYSPILSVRNDGAIRDLPDAASVEIPVRVGKDGLERRNVGNCPHFLHGVFCEMKEADRLAVEAVRHRSYDHALQSLLVNPFVHSYGKAKAFLDTIIKEEGIEFH